MALTHNFKRQATSSTSTSALSDFGNKVRSVGEIIGAAKGLYDIGKVVYQGVKTIGPIVASAGII